MKRSAVALLLASACLPRTGGPPDRVEPFTAGGATFRIAYGPGDAVTLPRIEAALTVAAARVVRWGGLPEPVTVTIHPSHDALEQAVHREGYGWLRAWARYASVDLQSPRTWGLFGASDRELTELLVHELTHCAMYQNAASRGTWPFVGIPLWFREGMASFTAGQAYRRADRDALRGLYGRLGRLEKAAGDPLVQADRMYQGDSEVVYATAHWAFEFLMSRYGEARVRALLGGMAEGHTFPVAFQEVLGVGQEEFEAEFRRYIRWHGWR